MLGAMPAYFASAQLLANLNWLLSKRIVSATTTYPGPYTGKTFTYPLGIVPMELTPDGAVTNPAVYIEEGDRAALFSPYGVIQLAWAWGYTRDFDASVQAWMAANGSALVDAFDTVPYQHASGLVTQYPGANFVTGAGCGVPWLTDVIFDGDNLYESCMAAQAALQLSELFFRCGDQERAAFWLHRYETIKTGIQSQFVVNTSPRWEYLHERWLQPLGTVTTPETWGSALGDNPIPALHGATCHLESDPDNLKRNCLRLQQTNASYAFIVKNLLDPGVTLTQPFQALVTQNAVAVYLGEDRHFKYARADKETNLPADITYLANHRYQVEARSIDWVGKTYQVWVRDITAGTGWTNCGAVPFNYPGGIFQRLDGFQFTVNNTSLPGTSECRYFDFYIANPLAANSNFGPTGYLPWSNGARCPVPSPVATAFAAWSGLLTPAQTEEACRYMTDLYDQPDLSRVGYGNYFSEIPGARNGVRLTCWSDDAVHGKRVYEGPYPGNVYNGNGGYGEFVHGAYWWATLNWTAWCLHKVDPARSSAFARKLLTDMVAGGISSPHECYYLTTGQFSNSKYVHHTLQILSMLKQEQP